MGCGSCGTGGCSPAGCGSNGGCSSGGCNRLNTYNWLSDIPKADFGTPYNLVEISFNKGSRKAFFKNTTNHFYEKGDYVAVESSVGFDVGAISLTGEIVKLQMAKKSIKENSSDILKVLRLATPEDIAAMDKNKPREKEMLVRARAIARELNLEMKITEVEIQADGKKGIFYYIAEDRVDFRELIKHYAYDFNVKVEMMQIGIRQEAAKVGGIGSCGRELCCSTWLSDFKSVSTVAARYQNLSINQAKLSGQCGRLKCCLNYELDTYMDALKGFPNDADKIQIANGTAFLIKKDIFKNLMWYTMKDSSTQYPLSIERVLEIKALNAKGIKPEEIGAEELEKVNKNEPKEEFVDVVGAFSLKALEKKEKEDKLARQKANKEANKGNKQDNNTTEGKKPQGKQGNANNSPNNNPNNNPNNKGPRPNPNQAKKQNQRPNPNGEAAVGNDANANPNQGPRPQQNKKPNLPRAASAEGNAQGGTEANSNKPKQPNQPNPSKKPNLPKPNAEGNAGNSAAPNAPQHGANKPNLPKAPQDQQPNPSPNAAPRGEKRKFQPKYGDKKPPATGPADTN